MRRWMWALSLVLLPVSAWAQTHHVHHPAPDTTASERESPKDTHEMSGMGHDMSGMAHEMSGMGAGHPDHGAMSGMYGPYPMTRETSGTAWQPDLAAHESIHLARGQWMLMLHGALDLVRTRQGGERGDEKVFSDNMLMALALRPIGPGKLGLRAMVSGEPTTIGKSGYPLLLQTGETADGRTPLIDRQHPHDLFMELAVAYSVSRGNRAAFLYAGWPGEPALGPPAFMHRFSGMSLPEAPITHHWLDSTHITYGVLTAGAVIDRCKLEVSAFRGREPDQDRWNIETLKLDSHAIRVSFDPNPAWALQASVGRLHSPEQLEPEVNTDRATISAMYDHPWEDGRWETTLAWGRNHNRPGHVLDALLAETSARWQDRHTVFGRWERAEKDELFPAGDPRAGRTFSVAKASVGYRFDLWRTTHVLGGLGVMGTVALLPFELVRAYGGAPTSGLLFARLMLR